jgi:hypothetical protein
MIFGNMGSARNSPFTKLCEKPYAQWTDKQRKWFEREYKRAHLPIPVKDSEGNERLADASPRGRKRDRVYDALLYEREMAKLSGTRNKIPTYWQQASKIPDQADRRYRRLRLVRASQRRQRIFSNPPKD